MFEHLEFLVFLIKAHNLDTEALTWKCCTIYIYKQICLLVNYFIFAEFYDIDKVLLDLISSLIVLAGVANIKKDTNVITQ